MLARSVLNHILDDEGLTRNLGDEEARALVEWLVEEAEALSPLPDAEAVAEVRRLRQRGRALGRFVRLWAIDGDRKGAMQLAASERFDWPLPDGPVEPGLLMQHIVWFEARKRRHAA
jgi:hypothetical protein